MTGSSGTPSSDSSANNAKAPEKGGVRKSRASKAGDWQEKTRKAWEQTAGRADRRAQPGRSARRSAPGRGSGRRRSGAMTGSSGTPSSDSSANNAKAPEKGGVRKSRASKAGDWQEKTRKAWEQTAGRADRRAQPGRSARRSAPGRRPEAGGVEPGAERPSWPGAVQDEPRRGADGTSAGSFSAAPAWRRLRCHRHVPLIHIKP